MTMTNRLHQLAVAKSLRPDRTMISRGGNSDGTGGRNDRRLDSYAGKRFALRTTHFSWVSALDMNGVLSECGVYQRFERLGVIGEFVIGGSDNSGVVEHRNRNELKKYP